MADVPVGLRPSPDGADDLALTNTRALLTELALRMEYRQNSLKGRDLGRLCLEAIANLSSGVLADTRVRPWSDEQTGRFAAYFAGDAR